jgi:hypothetical protein
VPQHFKVEGSLEPAELDQLKEFVREKNYSRTTDDCHAWVLAKGYRIGRTAVSNWLAKFRMEDRFRASNDVAKGLMDAAKEQGTVAISDAATLQLSQMLFEQLSKLQADEKVSTKELWGLSMALKNVVMGKRHVEKLKGEIAEAVKAAEAKATTGASAGDVVATIKKALGIAA